MEEKVLREQIVETGLKLLKTELVARTWGNVSCRADEKSMLITPSGLDYTRTTVDDIALITDFAAGAWEGRRRPSSEWGIHAASYARFPDVNFVIHTHQTYATALGLCGWDKLDMTEEENMRLGGIARADYGPPGKKKLWDNVDAALSTGAHAVLMAHHGALILGSGMEDAMERAMLLEDICRRSLRYTIDKKQVAPLAFMAEVNKTCPLARAVAADEAIALANEGKPIKAQLDDMAQMIGRKIPVVKRDAAAVCAALQNNTAVLVPDIGAVAAGTDEDDSEALAVLVKKAAIAKLHTAACGVRAELPMLDAIHMRRFYLNNYSKRKRG